MVSRRSLIVGGCAAPVFAAAGASLTWATENVGGKAPAFDASMTAQEKITPYKPRLGRKRPLVVVVAQNEGTETTDFVVPFGIVARSGVADVVTASDRPGPANVGPLLCNLDMSLAEFDRRHPEGADYAIIPNVVRVDDQLLIEWVKGQAKKGASIVSVCVGALVVAHTGLMDGRRATSYFGNEKQRAQQFPKVLWQKNIRYVADGNIISSAGISASMPISVALVEAIGGHEKALATAKALGMTDWNSTHNSDAFSMANGEHELMMMGGGKPKEKVGVVVRPGDDEISLALIADAYVMTGRCDFVILADAPGTVRLASGLELAAEKVLTDKSSVDRLLPPLSSVHPTKALDVALADIAKIYGIQAARNAARFMEYPGFKL